MITKSHIPYLIAGATGAVVAALIPLLVSPSKADTKLLPFQGRLTDAAGTAIADGAKVVEFKMYDAPTGGTVKWAGEVHKLSVNGGLVNTMLGSKASLGSVDFSTPTYLQITVDAQATGTGAGVIDAADPPLLPRQSVVPSVFAMEAQSARNSTKLQGFDWTSVFDNGNPTTGKIDASRLADGSITNAQIAPGTVTGDRLTAGTISTSQIAPNAIVAAGLANDSVTSAKIVDGEVRLQDLASDAVDSSRIVNGQVTTIDLADGSVTPVKNAPECAVYFHELDTTPPAGAAGWQVRALNEGTQTGLSISRVGNTITLQPGTYLVNAEAVVYSVETNQLVFRDVTNGSAGALTNATAVIRGISGFNNSSPSYSSSSSSLAGIVTVSGSARSYELWHYVGVVSGNPYTFGMPRGTGGGPASTVNNRYAQISIIRLR